MRPAPLDRKVLRDLWRMRFQVLAVALLIGCGVAVATMSFSAQAALARAQDRFYAATRFADVFADAKRAPVSLTRDLAAIGGVRAVDTRLVGYGLMNIPGLTRPATARVIALPDDPSSALNGITLVQGRVPDPQRLDEVVALATFLQAAHLRLGQRLTAVIGGREVSFKVVGAALSPEFVYVPAPESFMPDDAHQAVFWAPRTTVEQMSGMSGVFTAAALSLAPGASAERVLPEADRLLRPYGGRAAVARKDQPSHAFLAAELKELSTSATILPPFFLIVAAALVHLTVVRMVEAEREQIGLLKAFGYGDWEAAGPYLKLAAAIGVIGAGLGGLAGAWLGVAIIDVYRDYFRFPELDPGFHWPAFLGATLIAVASALGGSVVAVRRAARLSPAVAMQPPRPEAYRASAIDRLLQRARVDQATRMILRHIECYPARAGLAVLGLAASLALLISSQFLFDSLEQVIAQSYFRTQRWSEAIRLDEPRAPAAVTEAGRLPGALAVEPVRTVAVRFRSPRGTVVSRIVGIDRRARLQQVLDGAGRPVGLAGDGLVLSEALAAKLGVGPGAVVSLDLLDGEGRTRRGVVAGLARDFSGFQAYMDRRALNRLVGEGDLADGAQLLVAPASREAFYRAVAGTPRIVGASSRDETVAAWRRALAEAFQVTITFYVAFAAAIAFGVAYNMVRISLSERSRDLATLHVLGFGHGECAYILAGELVILALAAIPLGLAGGYGMAHALVAAYSRDEVRLPAIIGPRSYGLSLAAYLAAVSLGGLLVARRIYTLDLISVLKTRE